MSTEKKVLLNSVELPFRLKIVENCAWHWGERAFLLLFLIAADLERLPNGIDS